MASRTEEVVLRISMIADDEATKKVQALNQQLSQLGQPAQHAAQAATKEVGEFEKALGNLARSSLGVTSSLVDLAKVIGPVGAGVALLGVELFRSIGQAKEWARAVVDMGNAARMSGMQPGQFRDLVQQFQRAGVSAQNAMQTIAQFNRATAELTMAGSARRDSLLRMSGAYRDQMADAIIRVSTYRTTYEKFNEVRHLGENAYNNELERSGDKTLAREKQLMLLEQFGASWLINVNKDFTQADERRLQNAEKASEKASELNDALTEEAQTREEIFNKTLGWTTDLEIRIIKLGTLLESNILDRLNQVTDPWGTHQGAGAPARPAPPAQSLAQRWRNAWGTGGGHPAAQFLGGDAADVLGLAPGSLGHGDITKGWRHSENVEDSRDALQQHVDDVSRHGTAVDTSTKEFHQLNQNVERLIDNGVFGPPVAMAKGGVVHGPTRALVGEAGPEAIVSKRGTQVVTKPTHATLGTDGAEAVVPLGAEHVSQAFKGSGAGGAYTSADVRAAIGARLDPNVPTDVLAQARHVALGGGPSAVDAFMKAQGYPKDPNWCGDFAASVVHSLGGTVPGGAQVASNWRNYGDRITGLPQPGDIAVAIRQRAALTGGKPIATGDTGSHVTFVQDYDPKSDRITGFGGNQAAWATTAPAKGFEYFRPHMAMAEGGIVIPQGHVPPRSLFSKQQFQDYLERTQALSNPVSDIGAAMQRGAAGAAPWLGPVSDYRGAATPAEALSHATSSRLWSAFRAVGGAAVSPITGAVETTVGRAYAALTGMSREQANEAAGTAVSAARGIPAITDFTPMTGAARMIMQGLKQGGSLAAPQSLSELAGAGALPAAAGPATGAATFTGEDDRRALDRSFGGGFGGGMTEGTITIEHQETGRSGPRKAPLFRKPQIARQTQMQPAEHGPDNHWSNAEDVVH
jgi:hypothetical protein